MRGKNFNEVVTLIIDDDPRYEAAAYHFMRQALDHTLKSIRKAQKVRQNRHVSGAELCEGIREYALEQYGPMTLTLFNLWGMHSTEDLGEIVFNLVEYEVFGKTETDQRSDFQKVYDFEETFAHPFLPPSRVTSS